MLKKKEDLQEQFWKYYIQTRRENYLDYWLTEAFSNLDSQEKDRIKCLIRFLNNICEFDGDTIYSEFIDCMDAYIPDTEQPSFDDFLYKNNHKEKYRNRY